MLTAVRKIGEYVVERNINLTPNVSLKLNQNDDSLEPKVFFICIYSSDQNKIDVEIEDYNPSLLEKYPCEEGFSKGNFSYPFAPVTEFGKTFSKKILRWFNNFVSDNPSLPFSSTIGIMSKREEDILKMLEAKMNEYPNIKEGKKKGKTTIFLGVKIDGKYCGEYEEIYEYWKQKSSVGDWEKGYCSVCGEYKFVTSRTGAFQFDTLDKPGFIVGGMSVESMWKNIPVCETCRHLLKKGRKFIEEKLMYKFYGINYWLIPKPLIGGKERFYEVLDILGNESKQISLKKELLKRHVKDEDEIEKILSGEKANFFNQFLITNDQNESLVHLSNENLSNYQDFLSLNLMFVQKDLAAERIRLAIEDVLPSRIRKIYSAKQETDNIFKEFLFSGPQSEFWEKYSKYFNFGKIRTFFAKSDPEKRENDLDKYFLDIVESVFKGHRIDWKFLTKFYMNIISNSFINDEYFRYRVTDAMMTTTFLNNLNLLSFQMEESMNGSIFEEIFEKFGKSLNTSAKRGIFLLGALTQWLINLQHHLRGSAPFMKKLKGLKMKEEDIRALLPEVQNKFIEYDRYGLKKKRLAEEVSQFLLAAGDNWGMTVDEINYYFACGMNLFEKIRGILDNLYPQKEEDE
jgi:CRISPR-associated protein Csh1